MLGVQDLVVWLELLNVLIIEFSELLAKDPDHLIQKKKFDHDDDVVDEAWKRLQAKFSKFAVHQDNEFYNNLSQLKNVINVMTKPGFVPEMQGLTHFLFLKKVEFNEGDILNKGKLFLVEKITDEFFKSGAARLQQIEEGDEDDSSDEEKKVEKKPLTQKELEIQKNESEMLKGKRSIICAIFRNMQ